MAMLTERNNAASTNYHSTLIPGYERFIYTDVNDMFKTFPKSADAIAELNAFRKEHGLDPIIEKSAAYTECCFEREITTMPIALIGNSEEYYTVSLEHKLLLFSTFKTYLDIRGYKEKDTLWDYCSRMDKATFWEKIFQGLAASPF